jgi:acetyl esterase/lipase
LYFHRPPAVRAAAAPEQRKPSPQAAGQAKSAAIRDIPYTKPADAKNARRQTLDLYMPAKRAAKPPLVVFIHGGFWTLSDDDFGIGPAFAEGLLPSGVAVAVVRYRLAPGAKHPAQAEDVAAAVAYLARAAEKHGYDPKRIFLAGHSAGAHLAALVALDPKYLAPHGLSPQALAGVIGFSGIYDLAFRPETIGNQRFAVEQAFGADPERLRAASPTAHARAGAPPFLLFTADGDFPGYIADAKQFSDALAAAGNKQVERFVVPDRDHFSLVRVDDPSSESRSLMLEFMKVAPLPADMIELISAKRRWREPPLSTLPFWSGPNKNLIEEHAVDPRFVAELAVVYAGVRYELLEWPLEKFSAVDLFAYVDAQPEKFGRGNYLTITNFRGEKIFWDRREMARYKPMVVVGLDGERNLFRLGVFYQAQREYSWRDTPRPPIMARPIGGFIHFMEEPPEDIARQGPFYGLTETSFKLTEDDPLAPLRGLPKEILATLTTRNGCVYCHSLRGAGAESRHYGALDAKPHGGVALALESYPDAVWRRFVFNPNEAAKLIGASPNPVAEESRQALYDLVAAARRARK